MARIGYRLWLPEIGKMEVNGEMRDKERRRDRGKERWRNGRWWDEGMGGWRDGGVRAGLVVAHWLSIWKGAGSSPQAVMSFPGLGAEE